MLRRCYSQKEKPWLPLNIDVALINIYAQNKRSLSVLLYLGNRRKSHWTQKKTLWFKHQAEIWWIFAFFFLFFILKTGPKGKFKEGSSLRIRYQTTFSLPSLFKSSQFLLLQRPKFIRFIADFERFPFSNRTI